MGVWECSCETQNLCTGHLYKWQFQILVPRKNNLFAQHFLKSQKRFLWSFIEILQIGQSAICPFFHAAAVSTSVDRVCLAKQLLYCPGEVMGGRTALEDTCRWRFTHKPKRINMVGVGRSHWERAEVKDGEIRVSLQLLFSAGGL